MADQTCAVCGQPIMAAPAGSKASGTWLHVDGDRVVHPDDKHRAEPEA